MAKGNSYKALLSQSQSDKDQQNIDYNVDNASLQLQSDILATKKAITEANKAVSVAMGTFPFNSEAIKQAEIRLEGLEDGLKRLTRYQKDLFPTA